MRKVSVLVPCYKRSDYTKLCLKALQDNTRYKNVTFYLVDDGSNDKTIRYMQGFKGYKRVFSHKQNLGLRDVIIDFIAATEGSDFICKMDNDCLVPENWLTDLIEVFDKCYVDILSPNVMPSDAASKLGDEVNGYIKAKTVGGLWFMKRSLVADLFFEKLGYGGIKGAHLLIDQIQTDIEPIIGWTKEITVQDVGHWSGMHPQHVKSQEHAEYSDEVGRGISWAG